MPQIISKIEDVLLFVLQQICFVEHSVLYIAHMRKSRKVLYSKFKKYRLCLSTLHFSNHYSQTNTKYSRPINININYVNQKCDYNYF